MTDITAAPSALDIARAIDEGRHEGDRSTYYGAMLVLSRAIIKLAASHEAMRAVVEAAEAWRDCPIGFEHPAPFPDSLSGRLEIAVDSYRAARGGQR